LKIIDPILTILFAIIVLFTTGPVMMEIFKEFLNYSPINIECLKNKLLQHKDIILNVHNIHA